MMKKYHPWNIWNISSILSESHNSKLCLALWFRTAVRSLQQLSGSHNRVRDIHQVVAARYFLFDLFASSWFHQSDYTKSHKMMIISRMMITVIIMCSWSSFSTSHAEHPLSKFYPVTSLSTAKAKGVRNSLNCTEIRTDFLTVQSARRMDIKIVFHAVFFFCAGSPAGPSGTPHLFFGHSAAFRLWLMAQPRLERPVPSWWFNIYIRVACHHLVKSTSDFLQLLIIRTIQFSVSILIPFIFF